MYQERILSNLERATQNGTDPSYAERNVGNDKANQKMHAKTRSETRRANRATGPTIHTILVRHVSEHKPTDTIEKRLGRSTSHKR